MQISQAKCERNKKYRVQEREDEANKWYNTHTDTHTQANVMNIYESVRTTAKCKTRAKSQNIPTHTQRRRERGSMLSVRETGIHWLLS